MKRQTTIPMMVIAFLLFVLSSAWAGDMKSYSVKYVKLGGSGNTTIKADSASDAKAIYESKEHGTVVSVTGDGKTIEFMSYNDASEIEQNKH